MLSMDSLFTPERRKNRQKFYQTRQWRRLRAVQLRKSPFCETHLKMRPKRLILGSVCDHLHPEWETFKEFLKGPFQTLCKQCHSDKSVFDVQRMVKKEKTRVTEVNLD